MGRQLGSAQQPYADEVIAMGVFFAQIVSLIAAVFIIIWTVKRLHDAGKRGWFAFFLLPPFTLFFMIYLFIARSKDEDNKWGKKTDHLSIFGIKAHGAWRIIAIIFCVLLILWLWLMFYVSLIS